MKYSRLPSFKRDFRNLPFSRQARIEEALERLALALEESQVTPGLGLKQLRHGFWEIRAGLADRIIFHKKKDLIEFVLCGSHEDVKRFLRNI